MIDHVFYDLLILKDYILIFPILIYHIIYNSKSFMVFEYENYERKFIIVSKYKYTILSKITNTNNAPTLFQNNISKLKIYK